MNRELLETQIVKSSILRYLQMGFSINQIREKLEDIHLIVIPTEELEEFIKTIPKNDN